MAVLEHQLEDVCENCGILTGIEWNAERRHKANKRKGFIEIVRDFLVNKVGFGKPGNELWDKLLATYRIRNKLVHHGILIPDGSDNSTLAEDIRKTQGIEIKGNQLAITADFCNSIVSIMSDLFHQLREEHEKLCEKVE